MAKQKTNTKKEATKKTTETKAEAPRFEPIAERDIALVRTFTDTAARLRDALDAGDGDAIRADFQAIQAMARDIPRVVYIARRAGRRIAPAPDKSEENGSLPAQEE